MKRRSPTHPGPEIRSSEPPGQVKTSTQPPQKRTERFAFSLIDRKYPISNEMSEILLHTRLPWLQHHHSQVVALALFTFINGCISIGLMSALAVITHSPFIFPSLGPTAFLFFSAPTAPAASPRNTLIGHAIGAGAGYLSLVATGLTMAGPALQVGVTWTRVIAAALSLGLTAGLMMLFRVPHAPAGATTLIVSLGLLRQPWQLVLLMGAVVLLTLQALVVNRLIGIPYPLWNPLQTETVSTTKPMP